MQLPQCLFLILKYKFFFFFRFVHSDKKPYECLVCGMGFMRKPLLYAHMQTQVRFTLEIIFKIYFENILGSYWYISFNVQGHLNDTIVVNQPRLTTDDDQIVTVNADGEMELVESSDVLGAGSEDGEASEDTKLYIAELKDHVIIQDPSQLYGNSKGAMIVGESLDEDDTVVQDAVKHLIIDGQVRTWSYIDNYIYLIMSKLLAISINATKLI